MRILLVHNYYQHPGGEDSVFSSEKAILDRAGHNVSVYERHNDEISHYSTAQKLALFQNTLWNEKSARDIQTILKQESPQIVHFTNTFPLVSPAAYYTCQRSGVPVIQTIHNYRLACPTATFFRDGQICEACLGKTPPWPGVVHACYRNSRVQSAVVAAMLTFHRWRKTWQEQVDLYIAITDFSRQKLAQIGLPPEKIVVKPNFLHFDPGQRTGQGNYALFVGRLSAEKGLHTLLKAWRDLPDIPLKIVGDGPLMAELSTFVQEEELDQVELLGLKSREDVLAMLKGSRFLVFPSECYEGCPVTLLEAFACGVPVVISKLGGMIEIVEDRRTGLHFSYGESTELAEKVAWLWARPKETERMGQEARAKFEQSYTAERNYDLLMGIYKTLLRILM